MGMKNHEIVPLPLVSVIAGIHRGAVARTLADLCKHALVAFERSKKFDGYRLTVLGYDFLALKALCTREVVGSVGNQIGVGKESDVYVGGDPDRNDLCLKFHRLGRTSFRKIKEKRDYHKKRKSASWLYLSRLAAAKEFAFLKALASRGFPVPKPVDICRHLVVMGLIEGRTLCHVDHVENVEALYDRLMALIVKFARHGLIHGDFNEFNVMLLESEQVVVIDFPQMVSITHQNAQFYFERDVECIRIFFRRKFNYDSDDYPKFTEIERKYNLDVELEASGFTKQMEIDLNMAYDTGNFRALCEDAAKNDPTGSDLDVESEGEKNISSSCATESECGSISEGDEDKEELRKEEELREQKAKLLSRSERFTNWLGEATSQLEHLVVEEVGSTEDDRHILVDMNGSEEEQPPLNSREPNEGAKESSERIETEESQTLGSCEIQKPKLPAKHQRVGGAPSLISTSSTIPLEEIKRRVALEKLRSKEKNKIRVKGKQSAVQRGRKDNRFTINDYKGWI
ncbi:Rio2, N-terminal [Parelaphostrongylus tenuis]|uniref:non-specific serine/threonine protein kinase n=1 Tax=Parelaphostrongylus tenuis TaxID=148309 RepID=A0AAD5QTA0_PARTN|nr:Rio2, N-terminal [Parelaphostrongylus tenuis]